MNVETVLHHYLIAALWSSSDEAGEPLDSVFSVDDIAPETVKQAREDVADFLEANSADLVEAGQSEEQIGHDFWLTRNGHGAGFWDRGLGAVGDRLVDAARRYSGVDLYAGDDGKIYA